MLGVEVGARALHMRSVSRWDSDKGRNPHKNRMRVAIADDARRPWDTSSSSTGNAAPAARFTGQNVRGLPQLELECVAQFMKEQRRLVACLMEKWRVKPAGWESEEMDGFLIIHHGETARSCNRGYRPSDSVHRVSTPGAGPRRVA